MTDNEQRGDVISIEVAGKLLMLSAERVRQLIKSGFVPSAGRGKVTIPGAVQGYIRFLKESAEKAARPPSLQRAQDARAREVELRIAEKMRDLIPQDDALAVVDMVCGEVNKQLAGLPARITRDLRLRREIEAKLNEAKQKIAAAVSNARILAETGRDPTDPDAAD